MLRWILISLAMALLAWAMYKWRGNTSVAGLGPRRGRHRRRELHDDLESEFALRRGIADWRKEQDEEFMQNVKRNKDDDT